MKIFIEDEQFQEKQKCGPGRERTNTKVFIWSQESETPRSKDAEVSSPPDFSWWGENLGEQKQPTNENMTHFETGVFVCLSFKLLV